MSDSKHKKSALLVLASCAAIIFISPQSIAWAQSSTEAASSETKRQFAISSEEELAQMVAQLEQPATRLTALSKLAQFAGPKLYQVGSVFFSIGDRNIDALQQQAVEAIRKYADFGTVSQALDSTDHTLQFWGVWFWCGGAFKAREDMTNTWLSLIPKVKNLAVNAEESVRLAAIEGLQWHSEANAFLEERVNVETSPTILLRLLYHGNGAGLSERFNPLLLRLLNHQDKNVCTQALFFIGFNHNHAEMWQIKFDKSIADKVLEMTKSASEEEKKAALYALAGMKEKPRHQ